MWCCWSSGCCSFIMHRAQDAEDMQTMLTPLALHPAHCLVKPVTRLIWCHDWLFHWLKPRSEKYWGLERGVFKAFRPVKEWAVLSQHIPPRSGDYESRSFRLPQLSPRHHRSSTTSFWHAVLFTYQNAKSAANREVKNVNNDIQNRLLQQNLKLTA